MTLNTNKLMLRQMEAEDINAIFEYSKEKNVGPNAGWKPHESKEETKKIAEQIFLKKENVWGIILKENHKLVGTIGLIEDPKREYDKAKMIGYAISEKYWGKGIMTEAVKEVVRYGFEELELEIIAGYCYPFNARSIRVLEKCHFEYEGTLKKAEKTYEGKVVDNRCYALEREKYYANK